MGQYRSMGSFGLKRQSRNEVLSDFRMFLLCVCVEQGVTSIEGGELPSIGTAE